MNSLDAVAKTRISPSQPSPIKGEGVISTFYEFVDLSISPLLPLESSFQQLEEEPSRPRLYPFSFLFLR